MAVQILPGVMTRAYMPMMGTVRTLPLRIMTMGGIGVPVEPIVLTALHLLQVVQGVMIPVHLPMMGLVTMIQVPTLMALMCVVMVPIARIVVTSRSLRSGFLR